MKRRTVAAHTHDWEHDATVGTRTGRTETRLRCRICGKPTTAARLEQMARGRATQRIIRAIRARDTESKG